MNLATGIKNENSQKHWTRRDQTSAKIMGGKNVELVFDARCGTFGKHTFGQGSIIDQKESVPFGYCRRIPIPPIILVMWGKVQMKAK